jgi:hypothetical protein
MFELKDFEKQLHKMYSPDIELTQSMNMQNIINQCHFRLNLVMQMLYCHDYICSVQEAFMPDHFSFYSNVIASKHLFEQNNKLIKFILVETERYDMNDPITYIIAFPQYYESNCIKYLRKMERLKAFL